MPLLLEPDAEFLTLNYDALSPENQAKTKEWLGNYKQQQYDKGEPLFPTQEKASIEKKLKLRGMFEAPEKIDYDPGPMSANPVLARMQYANMALLSQRYQKEPREVSERYGLLMNDYTRQNFGVVETVDTAKFYALAQKEFQRMKQVEDTSLEGAKAALRGEDVIPALQAWQAKNLDRLPDSTEYTRGFLQAREVISGVGLSDVVDAYQRTMQGSPKDGDKETLKDFEGLLLDLPGAKRKAVLTAATMMAQARGEKAVKGIGARESGPMGGAGAAINAITGFFQEIGESGGRYFGKFGGIAKDEELESMSNMPTLPLITDAAKARHPIASGVAYTSMEKIDSAEKAADFIKEWKVTTFGTVSADVTRADVDEASQTAKQYRELDADEKKLIEAAQKREFKKNQIARELRSIAESSDPVGEISGAIGSTVAMAAVNVLTRGKTLPISWQLYSEANYDQLRLENPSLEPSEARLISRVSGAGEAGIDAFGIGLLRTLPSVAAVLKSGTSAAWRNAGARLGATFVFEQAQEGVQDLTMPFTRAVFEAVGIDTGLDMASEWERWKNSRGTVAIASIPLILLGAGIATHRDIKDAQNLLSSRDRLGEQGIIEVKAVPILEAARAGKMDEAQALYREAFKRRSPEVAEEYQAKLETQQKATAEAIVEVTRQGLIPEYTLLPGGKVVVTDLNDGSKATFDSWRDAQPVIEQNMNEMERINNDSILRIADDILQKKDEEVTVSPRSSDSLATRVRGGSMSPEDAIKAAIAANVIQGVNIDEARKIAADVFGESQEERIKIMRDAVERAIILGSNVVEGGVSKSKLFKGANLTTLIEETSEGRLKEGLRLGRYKKSDWLGLIQQAEEATGEKFLIGSTSDAVNASPDFAPRALVEAVSRIVVADVLGRLQDGRRIGSGSITKSLEENNSPLVAWVRTFKRLLASVLQTAKRIREARKTGKLGDEYDAYIDDLLGVDQQAALESDAAAEAEAIANEALNVGGTSYSEETPGPNGETFSFAGTRANVPQFMLDSLETAKTMAADGKDSELIRSVTGWFPGKYDGKMRWEIPDDDARYLPAVKGAKFGMLWNHRLDEVLDHPKLFSVYPYLRHVRVQTVSGMDANGSIQGDVISLNAENWDIERFSTLLHEVQHWIQRREGFAVGSNPTAENERFGFLRSRLNYLESTDEYKAGLALIDRAWNAFDEANFSGDQGEAATAAYTAAEQAVEQIYRDNSSLREARKITRQLQKLTYGQLQFSAKNAYSRSAGEIEARDVQARQSFTPEQRKAIAPYSSENIDKDAAIIMGQSGIETFSLRPGGLSEAEVPIYENPKFLAAQEAEDTKEQNRIAAGYFRNFLDRVKSRGWQRGDTYHSAFSRAKIIKTGRSRISNSTYFTVLAEPTEQGPNAEVWADREGLSWDRDEDTGKLTVTFDVRVSDHEATDSAATHADIEFDVEKINSGDVSWLDLSDTFFPELNELVEEKYFGNPESSRADGVKEPLQASRDVARHAELEAKHNAGTITAEETAEAQRMVDKAAKKAGYLVDRPVYHGTASEFTEFRPSDTGRYGARIYTTTDEEVARQYAYSRAKLSGGTPRVIKLYADKYAPKTGDIVTSSRSSEFKSADPFTGVPLDQRFNPADNRITYSLRSGDFSARMEAKFSLFQAKPELRLAIAQVAKERALRLGAEWIAKGDVIRNAKDIGKEARMREALAYEARMNEYLDSLTPNARQTLEFEPSALEDDPLVSAMLDFGKLMSFTTAKKTGKIEAKSGDYDGQPWLPSAWYSKGAGIMPDQMAQAMFDAGLLSDAYSGTLWSEVSKRIESTRKDKAAHREAVAAYKAAEKYARDASRAEADQWAEGARKRAGSPKAQRDMLKGALRTLDGILAAAPAEVRARVGGYVKLAGLATDEAMLQEIERRIDKLNVELEKYLKKEYRQQIAKLFKRYAPKKDDKGRITSNITADAAEDIGFAFDFASLDDANQEKEMAALEKTLEESEDSTEIQDAIGKLAIVQLFHKLEERESSELEAAAMWLKEVGGGARETRKIIDAARAEWVKEAKNEAKTDASNGKLSSLPDAENVEADVRSSTFKRFTNDVKGFLNSALFTLGQQLEIVFGQDSRITTEFHRRAVMAANNSTDIKRDIEARRAEFVAKLFSTKSRIQQAGRMGALTVPTASGVIIEAGGKTTTIDVPAEVVLRIIEGTADLKALGFTNKEASTLADAWADNEALPAKRQKRVFKIERRSDGKNTKLTMSQDEAIQYLLWSKQKASREQMERDGWNKESFRQLNTFLSDDAKALAGFFADEYARMGRLIEPVYRRMFYAPFPQVTNYSPIFRDISSADSIIDIDQQGHGSGVSSGFILARNKNARSAMRRTSAISAFMQHAESAAHWVSHVELVRDLRSVLIDKEVQNAIRSNGRTAAANGIKKRVMQLENQGKVGAAGIAELDSWGSRLLQARAFKGLAWRISPVLKQTSAYFNPLLADVPAWDYMRGTARLLSGKLDVSAMWKSPDIQRRIAMGFSAEAKIAMDRLGYTGSTLLAAMGKGMMPMALIDAGWTTAGAAVAFDYYRRNNIKSGMNETMAENAALDQLEMMIAESAQPADAVNRSLIEGIQNPWLKSMWMFSSESRKTLAIEIMALRRLATGQSKNKAMDAQRAVVAHVVMAATTQLMAGVLSLLMGDDDDREREWSVEEWAAAIAAGPINGLFLFGDAVNYIGRRLFGLYAFEPSTAIGQAVKTVSSAPSNLDKVINGEPEEQRKAFLRLGEAVGQAASLVGPGNPFTATDVILGNPLKDAEKILTRFTD
jgi:hypothetical protein